MSDLIHVVVIDDSLLACRLRISYLQTAPGLQVVGTPAQVARHLLLTQRQLGRDETW
jgi:hypothetical protein